MSFEQMVLSLLPKMSPDGIAFNVSLDTSSDEKWHLALACFARYNTDLAGWIARQDTPVTGHEQFKVMMILAAIDQVVYQNS